MIYSYKSGAEILSQYRDELVNGQFKVLLFFLATQHDEAFLRDVVALASDLGGVDELFDNDPGSHEMNQRQKGLAQFLIPRSNAAKLFEGVEESFYLLA